jgi:hypothetical protein
MAPAAGHHGSAAGARTAAGSAAPQLDDFVERLVAGREGQEGRALSVEEMRAKAKEGGPGPEAAEPGSAERARRRI